MKKFNFQLICAFFFSLLFFSCSQKEQNLSSTASSEKNSTYTASELGLSEADFSKLTPKQREQRAANLKLSEFVSLKEDILDDEFRICLLTRLSFMPSQIANLLGASKQSITNKRKKLVQMLFKSDNIKKFDALIKEME